jgi:hypothetical protein
MKNKITSDGFTCGFSEAWVGSCKEPVDSEDGQCEKHAGKICVSCGAKATQSCDSTGSFVCGEPLCNDCEHTLRAGGTNGGIGFNASPPPEGMKDHCKKSEQKHQLWIFGKDEKTSDG